MNWPEALNHAMEIALACYYVFGAYVVASSEQLGCIDSNGKFSHGMFLNSVLWPLSLTLLILILPIEYFFERNKT